MASPEQVRQYLAYWLQLGKKVMIRNGESSLLPRPVLSGNRYSDQFEECWQQVTAPGAGDAYLEGTHQTITELLTPKWDLHPCARCEMPVPMLNLGFMEPTCPCADLPFWPDPDRPQPRSPISNSEQLTLIRDRLLQSNQRAKSGLAQSSDDTAMNEADDRPIVEQPDNGSEQLTLIRDRLQQSNQ